MFALIKSRPPRSVDAAAAFYATFFRDAVWKTHAPDPVGFVAGLITNLQARGLLTMPAGATARSLAERVVMPNQPGTELDFHPVATDLARAWCGVPPIPKA